MYNLTEGYGVRSDCLGKESEGVNLLTSIPSPPALAPLKFRLLLTKEGSPCPLWLPALSDHDPLLAAKSIGQNSALWLSCNFSGAFFRGAVPRFAWATPRRALRASLSLLFEGDSVEEHLPQPPEFAAGTLPAPVITTSWNGARRGAGRRCSTRFGDTPGSPSPAPKAWLGAAPRTCSSQELGHKLQPLGAKICSSNRLTLPGSSA